MHSGCLFLIQDLTLRAIRCGSLLCMVVFIFQKNPVTFLVDPVLSWFLSRFEGVPSGRCASLRCPHILWVSECGFRRMERARVKECEGGMERLSKDAELSGPLSPAPCQTVNQNKWFIDCAILALSLLVFSPPEGGSNWRSIVLCPLYPFLLWFGSEWQVACHLSHL